MVSDGTYWTNRDTEEKRYRAELRSHPMHYVKLAWSLLTYATKHLSRGYIFLPSSIILLSPLLYTNFSIVEAAQILASYFEMLSTESVSILLKMWQFTGLIYLLSLPFFNPWRNPTQKSIDKHMTAWSIHYNQSENSR